MPPLSISHLHLVHTSSHDVIRIEDAVLVKLEGRLIISILLVEIISKTQRFSPISLSVSHLPELYNC